jgi:hypothetical protein
MPATTLDTTGALIVIDLQKGIVGIPTAHPTADIIAICQLARAFRKQSCSEGGLVVPRPPNKALAR